MKKKDKSITKKGPGRKSLYDKGIPKIVFKLCLLGATDLEIADFLSVSKQTINNWKKIYPEFNDALHLGKMRADTEVAESLYRSALGFTRTEVKTTIADGIETITKTEKYYPPSTTAGIFWLKNRRSAQWRDRVVADIATIDPVVSIVRDVVTPGDQVTKEIEGPTGKESDKESVDE